MAVFSKYFPQCDVNCDFDSVIVIGISSEVDQAELEVIATGSGDSNVFTVLDFKELEGILSMLVNVSFLLDFRHYGIFLVFLNEFLNMVSTYILMASDLPPVVQNTKFFLLTS